jgi:hypothetical protein
VLLRSIEDGASLITWDSDGFAYADAYDDEKKRYVGLRAGEHFTLGTRSAVLVKPEVARAQIEAERQTADQTPENIDRGDAVSADVADDVSEPKGNGKPTRFYGSVHLSPVRLGRDAGEIAEAVVQHLASLLGSDVEIRLDIQAKIPDGAPDEVVRTVTENARTLKFDQHGFERD